MKDQKSGGAFFRPAGIIFDMDGLMPNTERPMLRLWIAAVEKSGWIILPPAGFPRRRTAIYFTFNMLLLPYGLDALAFRQTL
jgi:hypothetical protein